MIKFAQVVCFVLSAVVLVGCQPATSTAGSESKADASNSHSVKLHKPRTLSMAVDRLSEINESLLGADPFPEPKKIEYVEVIHGTGPGGHSHYYLASNYDANSGEDDHDMHSEEGETVKRLVAEVPLRVELSDVVRWLPDIAANSNLSEGDWTKVSDTAKDLKKIISAVPHDTSDDDFRKTWKLQSKDVEPMLEKLQTLTGKPTGETK